MMIDHPLTLLPAALAQAVATLTLTDLATLVGIITALLGALVNLVYTWRKDRREQRASDAAWSRKDGEREPRRRTRPR